MEQIRIKVRTSQRVVAGSGRRITLEPEIPSFDRLRVTGPIAVELVREGTPQVVLDDNLASWLVADVHGGELELRLRDPEDPKASIRYELEQPVRVTLPITQLDAIELHGGCSVASSSPLETRVFELETHGSTNTVLRLEAESVRVECHGSGRTQLDGKADRIEARVHGSGTLAASGLEAKTGSVRLSGSGTAEVAVTHELDARVSGRGVIRYHGSPTLRERVSGKGRVERA